MREPNPMDAAWDAIADGFPPKEEHMKHLGYVVVMANEGCGEEYIGAAPTLREARRLARRHERGEIKSTPEWLYDTARAAGRNVSGCSVAPPHEDEPVAWTGRRGAYAICRATERWWHGDEEG